MDAIGIATFTVLGVIIASFLNVCIDRLPARQSLISPPSHCPSCRHRLAIKDLVPVLSYLWLRGRCRYCRAAIPRRILWVEIANGALFACLYSQYGMGAELAVTAFYCCLFIVLMVIDLEHGLILNRIVYPAMVAALLISVVFSVFLPGLAIVPGIKDSAIGGGIGFGLALLVVIFSRGGMGLGDVKMAALMGFAIGFPAIFFTLILAAIIGGIVAAVLLLAKKKKRKEGIPFAPILSLATITTLLGGGSILNWYQGLF